MAWVHLGALELFLLSLFKFGDLQLHGTKAGSSSHRLQPPYTTRGVIMMLTMKDVMFCTMKC